MLILLKEISNVTVIADECCDREGGSRLTYVGFRSVSATSPPFPSFRNNFTARHDLVGEPYDSKLGAEEPRVSDGRSEGQLARRLFAASQSFHKAEKSSTAL